MNKIKNAIGKAIHGVKDYLCDECPWPNWYALIVHFFAGSGFAIWVMIIVAKIAQIFGVKFDDTDT